MNMKRDYLDSVSLSPWERAGVRVVFSASLSSWERAGVRAVFSASLSPWERAGVRVVFSASLSSWERAGVRVVAPPVTFERQGSIGRREPGDDPHPRPLSQEERGERPDRYLSKIVKLSKRPLSQEERGERPARDRRRKREQAPAFHQRTDPERPR
jgi:hypothetical protein